MKKKILTAMIAAAILAMLTACGSEPANTQANDTVGSANTSQTQTVEKDNTSSANDTAGSANTSQTQTVEKDNTGSANDTVVEDVNSSNPLIAAKFVVRDVMNGTKTEKIGGQYAYVQIPKATLKKITEEQFAEFCQKRVTDSGYNWVSIICGDGTGITFSGSLSTMASYGEVDEEGAIVNSYGDIFYQDENGNLAAENGHYVYKAKS